MAFTQNIPVGRTLYMDEVPLMTITRAEHKPFKVEIKIHNMIKCKVKLNGCKYPFNGEPGQCYDLALGDSIIVEDANLSAMVTRIGRNGGKAANVRISCEYEGEFIRFTYQ